MSRHRDVRNLDYDEEYDEAYDDAVYGHSVDDHEYGVSPNTEQYLYSQRDASYGFGAYFPETEKIKEEEENFEDDFPPEFKRRDSSNFERPRLSSEDEVQLNSVLDEIRNVVGDQFSDTELIKSILEHKYDFEASLNAVLNLRSAINEASGLQTAAQLPKTPKRERALGTQDELFKFYPFSFMLPLPFYFSSAFVFENGRYERVPVTKYVKEWQIMIRKTVKEEREKLQPKEFDKKRKIFPLSEKERLFLLQLQGLSLDNRISNSTSNQFSYFSDCASNKEDENRKYKKIDPQVPLADTQLTTVTIPCSPHNTKNILDRKYINITESITNSYIPELKIQPITSNHQIIDCASNLISSSPPPGFHVKPLTASESCLSIPILPQVKATLQSHKDIKQNPLLSSSKLTNLTNASLLKEVFSKTSSIDALIEDPQLIKRSSLSALASAHLKQTGNINFAIPMSPSATANHTIPPLPCSTVTALQVEENANSFPHLYMDKSVVQDLSAPYLQTENKNSNIAMSQQNVGNDEIMKSNKSLFSFSVPALDSKSIPTLNVGSNLNYQANNICSYVKTSPEFILKYSHLNQAKEVNLNSNALSHSDPLSNSGDAGSLNIDLNVALTKNQISGCKTKSPTKSKFDCNDLAIESLVSPTLAERRCLKREPSTSFGEVILLCKRSGRKKAIIRRQLFLPYKPFDFLIPSPDDIVGNALENTYG